MEGVDMMKQEASIEICTLEEALAYQNDMVIHKFLESFDLTFAEAEDLFREMLRFTWLTAKHQLDQPSDCPRIFTHDPLFLLDEMRHTFVLFTKEYADYCLMHFGFFVHHEPTTEIERRRMAAEYQQNPEAAEARRWQRTLALYRYIYETLGEATLRKWYEEYPAKYPPHVIRHKFRKWADRA